MCEQALMKTVEADLNKIRKTKPLIHNITNFVVMNSTANVLLAIGASPVMAHAAEEVEEMTAIAGGLVLNIGTLTPVWVDAMVKAGKRANREGIPVILDPVGSGATRLRTESSRRILDEVKVAVVRGNASEVLSLARSGSRTRGVDSLHSVDEAADVAVELAVELDTTLAITGAVDLITDGHAVMRVSNGHAMMSSVTGTGCAATAVIGAFLAVEPKADRAAAFGLACYGLAGELAAGRTDGPGSFQVALLDELYALTPERLGGGARIDKESVTSRTP